MRLCGTEQTAKENLAVKEARRMAKEATDVRERPLTGLLQHAGYLHSGERMMKKTLLLMLSRNEELQMKIGLPVSASRSAIVDALLRHLESSQLSLVWPAFKQNSVMQDK